VEGLLSAIILNVVVGLITSLISGGSVWLWGRARVTRRQRERARFFGLSPGDTCRIVAPQAFGRRRPLFLICGQTGITNRAAASYLRDNYRSIASAHGPGESWCVVLRVVAPPVYGHQMTELAADVSASSLSALAAAGGPP
jgi:hypothetical protein